MIPPIASPKIAVITRWRAIFISPKCILRTFLVGNLLSQLPIVWFAFPDHHLEIGVDRSSIYPKSSPERTPHGNRNRHWWRHKPSHGYLLRSFCFGILDMTLRWASIWPSYVAPGSPPDHLEELTKRAGASNNKDVLRVLYYNKIGPEPLDALPTSNTQPNRPWWPEDVYYEILTMCCRKTGGWCSWGDQPQRTAHEDESRTHFRYTGNKDETLLVYSHHIYKVFRRHWSTLARVLGG